MKREKICYIASTPQGHNYNGFQRDTMRAYICANDRIECLFSNLKKHRANQAIKAWNNGDVQSGRIPAWVWNNYITNGYNTRRGLYADYSSKEERIKEIARSHADYLGMETGDSSADHDARVAMRNN